MKILTTFATAALLLAVLAAACGDDADDSPSRTPTPVPAATFGAGAQIGFDTFLVGANTGVMTEGPVVFKIEDQRAWAELWSTHVSVVVPTPTPPAVAFGEKMLIAVFDQQQSSGGYAIEVQSVVADENGIVVEVLRTLPGRGCAVTQALTQPFHMVLADAAAGDVQLLLTDRALDC